MEEDKRLDLDQPFLSVRRFSLAAPSPESKAKSMRTVRTQPKPPQPPPYRSELKSGPLREPGTVPFTWEQSPGRPKYEGLISPDQSRHRPPIAPKLPPGRAISSPKQTEPNQASDDNPKDLRSQESVPADSVIAKEEIPYESTELGTTSEAEETYFDAQDNLSRSESFYFNCSISGLSGLDGPDPGSQGTFATDPQVQDFMMGRFLPAAKAMASETPPHSHAPKKQPTPAAREQPRLRVKKASNVNKQHPLYRYNSSFLSRYMKQMSGLESELDDDDDDVEPENSTAKVCGLFPRFMLKSSFCILDPAQDIGPQNVEKLRKPSKTNRPAHKTDLRNKEVSARKIEPSASHSILQEDKGGEEKGCKSFRDLLASEGDEWKSTSGSRGPVVERTLYIDSVRTVNSRSSDTSSVSGPPSYRGIDFDVNAVGHIESLPRDIKEITTVDEKEITGDKGREHVDPVSVSSLPEITSVDSSRNEIKHIVFLEEKEILGHESVEPIELICSESRKFVSTCPADENIDIEQQPAPRSSTPGVNSRPPRPTFHIPPLLPKSPADSWLFRTLPSVPSRNSPARFSPNSHETDRFQVPAKPPSTALPKWESMIKTSRPSLESLAPIPES